MESIKLISNNVSGSDYLVSSIGADADYPVSRLSDADAEDLWMKTQTSAPFGITASLPSPTDIDFLALMRHNLRGVNLNWSIGGASQYNGTIPGTAGSPFDTTYFVLDEAQESSSVQMTFGSKSTPKMAEVVLGKTRSFACVPDFPGPTISYTPNMDVSYSRSGHRWVLWKGNAKWSAEYHFTFSSSGGQKADFEAFLSEIEYGVKAFWIQDHEGVYRWVEVAVPIQTSYLIPGNTSRGISSYHSTTLKLTEVFYNLDSN